MTISGCVYTQIMPGSYLNFLDLALYRFWLHGCMLTIGRIDKLMEGLKVKLETAHKASGGRKVNIISHSMGGLLVLCFLSLHNDVRSFSLGD